MISCCGVFHICCPTYHSFRFSVSHTQKVVYIHDTSSTSVNVFYPTKSHMCRLISSCWLCLTLLPGQDMYVSTFLLLRCLSHWLVIWFSTCSSLGWLWQLLAEVVLSFCNASINFHKQYNLLPLLRIIRVKHLERLTTFYNFGIFRCFLKFYLYAGLGVYVVDISLIYFYILL